VSTAFSRYIKYVAAGDPMSRALSTATFHFSVLQTRPQQIPVPAWILADTSQLDSGLRRTQGVVLRLRGSLDVVVGFEKCMLVLLL
jgi:hypothetical protein